jgi:alginate O-acetyltransferase complex protein AlgJ
MRWFTRLKPGRLPLAIGASVLAISWFYLTWNTTVGELVPALRFRTKATIAGIVEGAGPILSLDTVLRGTYQQWISVSIGKLSPIFKPAISWKNQIYYSLLGMSGSSTVVIGKDQQLFDVDFLNEYCSRDLEKLHEQGEAWAQRISQMQYYFESRGKVFLYIITPSKVAQHPQYIPDDYTCPAAAKDRSDKLLVYDDILDRHGVHFVDTASDLAAAREKYGISMFPRGGIHWNSLATALATQKVIAAVNARRPDPLLATFSFTWRISYTARGIDRDLLDLMNLRHPDTHYPVPELAYQSEPLPGACHPMDITEVGGSFLDGLNWTLQKLACAPVITDWFYWDNKLMHYANDHRDLPPIDPQARRRSLLDADVVILEENEASGPQSAHGKLMMREMAKLMQTASALATQPAGSPPPPPQ